MKGMKHRDYYDSSAKHTISLNKLIKYNLLFIIPIGISIWLSFFLGKYVGPLLEIGRLTAAEILMIPFTLVIFLFLIPYIRERENIWGVRLALIDFLIIGIFITVPKMLIGDYSLFLIQFAYLAGYVLLTFIYSPEVLGINVDLRRWFRKRRQLLILLIYGAIALFYIIGFAQIYWDIYNDPNVKFSFNLEEYEQPRYSTFFYYSLVSFTTVGYGDITPVNTGARLTFGMESVIAMIVNVVFIAILFLYVSNFQSVIKAEQTEIKRMRLLQKASESMSKQEKRILAYERREAKELGEGKRKRRKNRAL